MFILGGVCGLLIGLINEYTPSMHILKQMLIGTVIITVLEFIIGYIVNIQLNLNVWDYSNLKFNIKLFTKRKKLMNKALIFLAILTAPYLYLIPTVLIFDTLKNKTSFTKQEVLTTYIARYNNKISFSKNDFDNAFRMINELITEDKELAASLTYTYEKRRIIINLNNNIVEEEKLEKIALMVMITNSKIEEIIYLIDINNEIRFKKNDFEKEFNFNFNDLSKTEQRDQLESIIFKIPDPIKD